MSLFKPPLLLVLFLFTFLSYLSIVVSAAEQNVLRGQRVRSYAPRDRIVVECLNRTVDTGEHIIDSKGELQYIPFPICNETGRPLELRFGSEQDINCTLPTLPDPLFHLLEFYIHNDAPLSCRLASTPASSNPLDPPSYTHLQFALTGTLQLSHLHINPNLNVIVHTTNTPSTSSSAFKPAVPASSRPDSEGAILAATAYSLPPTSASPRLVIGDPLPLRLSVRWYSARTLPPSTSKVSGLGGHVHLSTVFYCLLSAGAGVAVSMAYWRGVELPRRMRRFGAERVGGAVERGGGYAWPGSGSGAGGGFGKRD